MTLKIITHDNVWIVDHGSIFVHHNTTDSTTPWRVLWRPRVGTYIIAAFSQRANAQLMLRYIQDRVANTATTIDVRKVFAPNPAQQPGTG